MYWIDIKKILTILNRLQHSWQILMMYVDEVSFSFHSKHIEKRIVSTDLKQKGFDTLIHR